MKTRQDPAPVAERRRPAAEARLQRSAGSRGMTEVLLGLQARVGNAALQRVLGSVGVGGALRTAQRLAVGGTVPPPPVAPGPAVPTEHPGFRATQSKISKARRSMSRHPSAASKAAEAAKAAKAPADAKESQAKTAKAGEMAAAPAPGFDKAAFIAAVTAAIAKQAPKNLEEADNFSSSGKSDGVAAEIKGKVNQSKDSSAAPMAEASAKAPDVGKAVDKPVTPLPGAPGPAAQPALDAKAAMPPKAPAEQTNLDHGPAETDQKMAEAEVTEQQLANSNEPEFTGALAAKKEGEQHSATAPAAFRASEAQQLAGAGQGAQAAGAAGAAGLVSARTASLAKVHEGQQEGQAKNESKRAQVSGKIKSIFDATKTAVDGILGGIDPQVNAQFTEGEAKAKAAFTAHHKARMDKYKDNRYSGVLGAGRWLRDKIADLPSEVNQFYVEAKAIYENQMRTVISAIADTVGREITRAKDRIAQGRREIATYVDGLEPGLRAVGKEAANEIGSQFDTLSESVDEKSQSLAEDLAEKYVTARNAVDEEIKQLQEENKGLWSKAKDAVGGAIETILKLKDMLLGVLARAANAVSKIIKDPIGFLGNFINAVKTGVMNFGSNILDHLKKGLQSWLFGALAEAGIAIPDSFDLKGIVTLLLSMLGLTWAAIKARLAKVLPDWVLTALEGAVEVVKILSTEGVGGLWKWIVGKLTDLKEQVMSQVEKFVITKVITAGLTWLVSLLNPAAAFIKACKMIYDAVMWFVDNAERLKDFVDSVLESVESIAEGGVGKVAGLIEATLGKAIPMVISGLASLLGLGGIAEKIQKILKAVQKPVAKVVDSLIKGVMKVGKKMLKKVRGKKKDERSPAERKAALDQAMEKSMKLVLHPPSSIEAIRKSIAAIKKEHRVKKLELITESHTVEKDIVHIEGANSPQVRGPSVQILRLSALQRQADAPLATTSASATISASVDEAEIVRLVGLARNEIPKADAVGLRTVLSMQEKGAIRGGEDLKDKTVASGGGTVALSGWSLKTAPRRGREVNPQHQGELENIGHRGQFATTTANFEQGAGRPLDLQRPQSMDPRDHGVVGQYGNTHAERQVYTLTAAKAIGVTRPVCDICQGFFEGEAHRSKQLIVVADPDRAFVFMPTGPHQTR